MNSNSIDVDLSEVQESPDTIKLSATKKGRSPYFLFGSGIALAAVLALAIVLPSQLRNQTTYNSSNEVLRSFQNAKSMRVMAKLQDSFAIIGTEDVYTIYAAENGHKEDAFGMNVFATMSGNGTKFVYQIYEKQIVYQEFNATSGEMTTSTCVHPDNLPPVAELAKSIVQAEVMDDVDFSILNCQDGKTVKLEWSNQVFIYCVQKDDNQEMKITTVAGISLFASIEYVDDADDILAILNEAPKDMNGTKLSCTGQFDTIEATRRLQEISPEHAGAHNIDFTYNREDTWSYDSISATLTSENYLGDGADLTAQENRFDYTNNMYDSQMYAKDRHHNTFYSTIDLINLMHGAGVRRLYFPTSMLCVFVYGANVIPRKEGLHWWSSTRYWGHFYPPNCQSTRWLELNTWEKPWNDKGLQQTTCDLLLSMNIKNTCEKYLDNMLIITHGAGALQVAGALASGKCTLGPTSQIIPIQPPMDGSSFYAKSFYQCVITPDMPKNVKVGYVDFYEPTSCIDGVFSPASYALYNKYNLKRSDLEDDFKQAVTYLRRHGFGRLCGDLRDGSTGLSTAEIAKLVSIDPNAPLYGQDAVISFDSCTAGFENSTIFRSHPKSPYYRAAISHQDGRLRNADSSTFMEQQPRAWLLNTMARAVQYHNDNPQPDRTSKC